MYNINYHFVWSVKYRRKIITPEMESYMISLIRQIAKNKGFIVDEFESGHGELWNHSYYVETVGDVSAETIRKYIKHQSK